MGNQIETGTVEVRIRVTVDLDPTDGELLDRADQSSGRLALADVVRSEIESNLESVSYVRQVQAECLKGAGS